MSDPTGKESTWAYGAVPLARNETHDKVTAMMDKEPRGRVLDVPTGTGVLADRLRRTGFEVSCCDISPSYFSIPDLSIEIGDLNKILPYQDHSFDYVICLDGIEHTENPFNTLREFRRVLKEGGKLFLSIPNFLNIERRLRFLFTGCHSKVPSHETIQKVWKNDLSMAHLSPLGYPLLKFAMEHYGFRVVQLEKDRSKPNMIWLRPLAWILRFYGYAASKKQREIYRLNETLSDEILMGGNTLIILAEKVA
ncbi:MAG TPA: class I SAM-dependent methyltransferase [Thermodesulfobacteriota bacterium]|nr:class I SAM-dependent methyltransferase [Thermodesulfobacteriota bacterium]